MHGHTAEAAVQGAPCLSSLRSASSRYVLNLVSAHRKLTNCIITGSLAWIEWYPIQEDGRGRLAIPNASQANIIGDAVIATLSYHEESGRNHQR